MIFEQRSGLQNIIRTTPVTFGMIVAVTVMFFVTIVTGGFTTENFIRLGALSTWHVYVEGDYWRFFTVMFLHGDLMHFIFNVMFGLFIISAALERLIGSAKFAIIFFVSGIGASLITYLYDIHIRQEVSLGVGASGAIYGVLGALLFLTLYKQSWFSPRDISSIRGLILINVIFTLLVGNISNSAHFGGLFMGFVLTAMLRPERYFPGQGKGFNDPYDPYAHERKRTLNDDDPFDYIDVVDDDDDDRRVW